MKKRVVVTGLGAVTPLGTGVDKMWNNLKLGKSGVSLITRFDTTDYPTKIGAEVKDFNAEDFIDKKEAKRMDRFTQYAVAGAEMAVQDSKLDVKSLVSERFGVIL
jgi:3-oxoacyl-[acyl-carrier-protein] synthase II